MTVTDLPVPTPRLWAAVADWTGWPDLPDAACRFDRSGIDPAEWCPERPTDDMPKGDPPEQEITVLRDVCSRCPERRPCLDWALDHDEVGVWGGLTRAERQQIRSARCPVCGGDMPKLRRSQEVCSRECVATRRRARSETKRRNRNPRAGDAA